MRCWPGRKTYAPVGACMLAVCAPPRRGLPRAGRTLVRRAPGRRWLRHHRPRAWTQACARETAARCRSRRRTRPLEVGGCPLTIAVPSCGLHPQASRVTRKALGVGRPWPACGGVAGHGTVTRWADKGDEQSLARARAGSQAKSRSAGTARPGGTGAGVGPARRSGPASRGEPQHRAGFRAASPPKRCQAPRPGQVTAASQRNPDPGDPATA
jgi:hypothetical protein